MRRLCVGLAVVAVVMGTGMPAASAVDAGVVTATSTFSGNTSCFEPPGSFELSLEFTGTLTAGGAMYVGSFATHVSGTYVQGPCSIRDVHGGVRAHLTNPGPVMGSSPAGTVAGTCGGGTFEIGALTGLTPLPEPQARATLSLGCEVSLNGGAARPLAIDATLVGIGTHHGVYTMA